MSQSLAQILVLRCNGFLDHERVRFGCEWIRKWRVSVTCGTEVGFRLFQGLAIFAWKPRAAFVPHLPVGYLISPRVGLTPHFRVEFSPKRTDATCATMSIDLQAIDTAALKARMGELRRYL